MQKFDIITEADARVLPRGETVMLARGGHITPLAADTLKERRVTVVDEGRASAEDASLAPKADIRTIAIASDHTGIALRRALVDVPARPRPGGQDLGTETTEPVDYPDVAASVAVAGRARRGGRRASSSTAPASGRRSRPTRSKASAR